MSGPPRPPPVRPAPRVPVLPRRGLALRSDHRDLRPDRPRPRRTPERRRRVPAHHDADADARLDDDGRPSGRPLPSPPRLGHRARPPRDRAHEEARAAPPRPRVVLPARAVGRPPRLPGGLRLEPRRRVPQAPRRRQARDHHLRRDARVLPADGPRPAGDSRAGAGGAAALPQALRPRRGGHLAARVRLPARATRCSCARPASGSRFLEAHGLTDAHPRPSFGVHAPIVSPGRHRLLRARHGVLAPGLERGVRLPGRLRLPRVLQGRRLGAAARLPRGLPARRRAEEPRHQVLPRHGRGTDLGDKQPYVRAWAIGEGGEPRRATSSSTAATQVEHLAGGLRPPADRGEPVRRRAVRPLVVRGPAVPGLPVPQDALRPGRREADHAVRVPRALPGARGRAAADVHLGRHGLRRGLAQRDERLDLPAPRHGGRAHGRAGAALRDHERARVARPRTRPRASCSWRSPRTGPSS